MSVKAKFYVTKVDGPDTEGASRQVWMNPVCRGVENAIWSSATPSGSIMMNVLNSDAVDQFEQGKEYYVTFEKAPDPPRPNDGHTPKPVSNKYGYMVCETCGLGLGGNKGQVEDRLLDLHDEHYAAKV